jgi:hypothetical protein
MKSSVIWWLRWAAGFAAVLVVTVGGIFWVFSGGPAMKIWAKTLLLLFFLPGFACLAALMASGVGRIWPKKK